MPLLCPSGTQCEILCHVRVDDVDFLGSRYEARWGPNLVLAACKASRRGTYVPELISGSHNPKLRSPPYLLRALTKPIATALRWRILLFWIGCGKSLGCGASGFCSSTSRVASLVRLAVGVWLRHPAAVSAAPARGTDRRLIGPWPPGSSVSLFVQSACTEHAHFDSEPREWPSEGVFAVRLAVDPPKGKGSGPAR